MKIANLILFLPLSERKRTNKNARVIIGLSIRHTGIHGLWTLGSGHWALISGPWTLGSGLWTLDATLWTLDSGKWTLSMTIVEQNQSPVSHFAGLNY